MVLQYGGYEKLCRAVRELNPRVVGAWVISHGEAVAASVSEKAPVPNKDKLGKIFFQAQVMAGIPRTNEDMYGRLEFVLIRHMHLDAMLFHLDSGDEAVLAVGFQRPYPEMLLAGKVAGCIASSRAQ